MYYHNFKKILSITMCIITTITVSIGLIGCSQSGFSIYFGINEMPSNIDPQKASTYSELLTVRNCFRGLMKLDENDNAILDIAESYTLNESKTEYTFKLKPCKWSNDTPVTAEDFVFAFTRATDPKTASPDSSLFLNISGATERLNGENVNLDVYAKDADTLVINLTSADPFFLSKLVNAAFMPCNKSFFENCKGKYGLGKKFIITNGNYNISAWSENNYIKLSSTDDANTSPFAKNVILTTSAVGKDNISRIKDKEISMTTDNLYDYDSLDTELYTIKSNYQNTYAIIFNKESEIGKNNTLTTAFVKSIHRELYTSRLNHRFINADSVISKDSILFNEKISNLIDLPKYIYQYDSEQARAEFLQALTTLKGGKLPKTSVLTVKNEDVIAVLTDVLSKWQNNLGAYINIETVSDEKTLFNKIKNGNYSIAFVPLSSEVNKTLNLFTTNSSSGMSINNPDYDNLISQLNSTTDLEVAKQAVKSAVDILSGQTTVIPIFSTPTNYIWKSEYKNVFFSDKYGTIDFSVIYK